MKVAVLSDIHANMEALSAVLDDAGKRGAEEHYCGGDIIGYGAFPVECFDTILGNGMASVMGNHDDVMRMILQGSHEFRNDFRPNAADALEYTFGIIGKARAEKLARLPDVLADEIGGTRIFMVHGSPRHHTNEYVYEYQLTTQGDRKRFLSVTGTPDALIMGHTHIPYAIKSNGSVIFNPGSVGQPRDSNPNASYAMLDTETMDVRIIRVEYDIEKAADKIRRSRIDDFFAERLFEGI